MKEEEGHTILNNKKVKIKKETCKVFRVDEEVVSSEEGFPFSVAKSFSGFGEKHCDEYLSDWFKISFNFSFNFSEEDSIISLTKDVLGSSMKVVSSLLGRMKGLDSTLRLNSSRLSF